MSARKPGAPYATAEAAAASRWPLGLLAAGCFLLPVLGGRITVEAQPYGGGFGALLASLWEGSEAPSLAHALIALCFALSCALTLIRSKVVQTPANRLALPLAFLTLAVVASVALSSFKWTSLVAAAEWVMYPFGFLAAILSAGRGRGPLLAIAALVAGCFLVATMGVMDYWQMRAIDPSWRIFANWTNPNALAGMLVIGFFLALGLTMVQDRINALAAGGAAVIIGFALMLTQSKGGLLALGAGLVALALAFLSWVRIGDSKAQALRCLGALAALAAIVLALKFAPTQGPEPDKGGGVGFMSRVSNSSGTSEQSAGFRTLLWKSSLDLIKQNPIGNGISTFRFYSTRPGRVSQTHLAHQSYLQLASEAGAFAALALVAFGFVFIRECFRGARKLPPERNLLRAGCFAAFVAAAVHNAVDSDLYFFGSGMALFVVMGLGAILAADALTPEQAPASGRYPVAIVPILATLFLLWAGKVELAKGQVVYAMATGDFDQAVQGVKDLAGSSFGDAEAAFLEARVSQGQTRISALERAVQLGPTPRHYRALADEKLANGDVTGAKTALENALNWDPNNLPALLRLMNLLSSAERLDEAKQVARRLIATEASTAFSVRAIPELMPTETLLARVFLAESAQGSEKENLLRKAVDGFNAYRSVTAAYIQSLTKDSPDLQIGGVGRKEVAATMAIAAKAAKELAAYYRASGDLRRSDAALSDAAGFEEAAAGFGG
ncbi:MAG: O-antigen ligase family protein [Armatimonadetes bacterium]|nr:O-antigen ligase family protein [Armatimonadota bacterium]